MRSALGKSVRAEFAKLVKSELTGFAEVKGHGAFPGDRLYCRTVSKAHLFVRLVPRSSNDSFTIEYGWSSEPVPPTKFAWAESLSAPVASLDGAYFRISKMSCEPFNGHWWVLADDMADAMQATQEAFRRPGDSPMDTLVRAASEGGMAHTFANLQETPIDEILPRVPELVSDCIKTIKESVIPFFDRVVGEID